MAGGMWRDRFGAAFGNPGLAAPAAPPQVGRRVRPNLERDVLRWLFLPLFVPLLLAAERESTTDPGTPVHPAAPELSDLSVGNLFTTGWDERFVKRPHPDGAPDLTLLRVQSNLLLSSTRTDYFCERTVDSSRDRSIQFVNELVEYSLNRRLMLAAFREGNVLVFLLPEFPIVGFDRRRCRPGALDR